MRFRLRLFALLVLAAGSLFAADAQAQGMPRLTDLDRSRYSPAAYYNYAEPGDVTLLVNVWGAVRNPGLYEIPEGTTLSTLFSLAGGPEMAARRRREDRTLSMELHREVGGRSEIVYETTMIDEIRVPRDEIVMEEGDVLSVEIETRQRFGWRDAIPVINAVGVLALAAERLGVFGN